MLHYEAVLCKFAQANYAFGEMLWGPRPFLPRSPGRSWVQRAQSSWCAQWYISREPHQTGFCQESAVTVNNLPSPSWCFQKEASEAAGPQPEASLDGNRKVAALTGLSHCCRVLHHEALWNKRPTLNKADPRCAVNGFTKAVLCAPAWVTTKYAAASALSPPHIQGPLRSEIAASEPPISFSKSKPRVKLKGVK